MREHKPQTADPQYLKLLQLAATESEDRVEAALRHLIEHGELTSLEKVRQLMDELDDSPTRAHIIQVTPVELESYDQLLGHTAQTSIEEVATQWTL